MYVVSQTATASLPIGASVGDGSVTGEVERSPRGILLLEQ